MENKREYGIEIFKLENEINNLKSDNQKLAESIDNNVELYPIELDVLRIRYSIQVSLLATLIHQKTVLHSISEYKKPIE